MVGALGRGFLAALIFPRGVDEGVMLAADAPLVDMDRIAGRGGSRFGDGDGDGEILGLPKVGEGESRGVSESNSSSGVEAMMKGSVMWGQ
jgi:hypothetical protein